MCCFHLVCWIYGLQWTDSCFLEKNPSKMLKMGLKIKCRVCKFLFENLSIKKVDDWLNINFLLQHKLSIPTERHIRHITLVFITFTEFLTSYSKCKKLTFCSIVKSSIICHTYWNCNNKKETNDYFCTLSLCSVTFQIFFFIITIS